MGGQRPPPPRDLSGGCGLCRQHPKTEIGLEVGQTRTDEPLSEGELKLETLLLGFREEL